jgi:antitoxin (DNA-binding transcriptional repressor) of toxin-antitoxin stability system
MTQHMIMEEINLNEAKTHLSRYLHQVEKNE